MLAGKIILALVGLAFVARTAYPAWTRMRAEQRERDVQRDANGIRAGMQPFASGEGDTALIFIHGFASGPSVFRFMTPALAESGFDCRVLRLPGFGESLERMRAISESDWRHSLEMAVERARADGKKIWLVGHSMGGTLAIDYALSHPERIEGLVLLAPLIEVSHRRSLGLPPDRLHRFARRLLSDDAILETAFPVDLNARAEGIDELRDRFLPISMYDAMFRLTASVQPRGADLDVPALMVIPGSDKVVSRRASRAYFSTLAFDRKLLLDDKRAGHVVPLDYGWENVVRAMKEFICADSQEGEHG